MNDCHREDERVSPTARAIAAFLVLLVFGLAGRHSVAAGVGILVLGAPKNFGVPRDWRCRVPWRPPGLGEPTADIRSSGSDAT